MVPGDLQPGATVGEYQIERVIGEGSFGKVYAAVHPMIGKRAAIKVLSFEHSANPQFVSRFLEEARAVNKIRHRNIVDIFSFGKLADGRNYLVMELLEGKPMADWLAERGAIPVHEALPILRKVARALEAAHKQNIAHRDLKPDNIFLTFDEDGAVFPILLDFGIAKLMGDSPMGHKTQTGTPMGTPLYMAPEQCRGATMDHRTDIYAFGIVVFEMLTGRRPFDSDNVMEILMAHLSQKPPTMSSVRRSLPAALDPPIERMLEKQPEQRPPSVTIAIEALIAAARSVGISVPSSRNVISTGSMGGTAPMGFDDAPPGALAIVDTVPETPEVDPRPLHEHAGHVSHGGASGHASPTTKESPVYTPPPHPMPHAAPAHTNVNASLSPGRASIPQPPQTQRKGAGAGSWIVRGGLALCVLGGGVFVATRDFDDDTTVTDDDSDEDDGGDDDGADNDDDDVQADSPDDTEADGVSFGNVPLGVGAVANTRESLRVTFIVVEGARKINVSRALEQHSKFEVVETGSGGVQRGKIVFEKSEWNDSVDHGAPKKSYEPVHGQRYEVNRQGTSVAVNKIGGALTNDERKDVERHVVTLLGPNLFASTLEGEDIAVGKRIDLPFVTTMHMMREYDRTRFPKLTGSMALQKVAVQNGERAGVFNASVSFQYKSDDGTLLTSDMTGTITISVSTGRALAVELYGPLAMSDPKRTFDPGTFSYNYTTAY